MYHVARYNSHPWGFFNEVDALQRELSRAFYGPESTAGRFNAPIVVNEDDKGVNVTLTVPGADPDKVDVAVEGNVVTVKGEIEPVSVSDDALHVRKDQERPRGPPAIPRKVRGLK